MKKLLLSGILLCAISSVAQNGALDPGFGTGGKVITSIGSGTDKAYGVALQADGKIVVAGYSFSSVFGNDFACVRYNSDGSLDTSFGTSGKVTLDLQPGSDDKAYSVDIQLDGKIILAGYSDNGSDKAGAVVRLNTDGTLDSSFGTGGKAFTNFTIYNNNARADEFKTVKIHHVTGNIVLAGTSVLNSDESRGVFARYTSGGVLDTSFANNGKLIELPFPESNTIGFSFVIEDIALQSNGKISAVGWSDVPGNGSLSYSRQYVCRLNANGTLDTTFSTDGFASNSFTTSDNKTYSLVLRPDNSMLFSGGSRWSATDYRFYYGTVTSGGSVSLQGSADFSANAIDIPFGMDVDSTGKIIVAGSSVNSGGSASFALIRLNMDFSADSTFGTSGFAMTSFAPNDFSEAADVVVQPDDKIILAGYSGNDFAIARYIGNSLSNPEFETNDFTIYPNPLTDNLNFNFKSDFAATSYEIYDMYGKQVLSGNIDRGTGTVNVSQLQNGIYLFKVDQQTTKFVKK